MNKVKVKNRKWKVFTVMLNSFQHLTSFVYLLQASKILKQVQDDNEGVNVGVNIDVKDGCKVFAKNLEIFNSGSKGRYKTCLA